MGGLRLLRLFECLHTGRGYTLPVGSARRTIKHDACTSTRSDCSPSSGAGWRGNRESH